MFIYSFNIDIYILFSNEKFLLYYNISFFLIKLYIFLISFYSLLILKTFCNILSKNY